MRSIEWWHCRWPWVPPNHPKPPHFFAFCTAILEFYTPSNIPATANARDFKLVHWSAMWRFSLVISECSLSGRGHGHVSNFYIVDLKDFLLQVYRWHLQLVRGRFVYDTSETMKVTRSCRGWVHMFITHCLQLNLQLHTINRVRTCHTSSFWAVAW